MEEPKRYPIEVRDLMVGQVIEGSEIAMIYGVKKDDLDNLQFARMTLQAFINDQSERTDIYAKCQGITNLVIVGPEARSKQCNKLVTTGARRIIKNSVRLHVTDTETFNEIQMQQHEHRCHRSSVLAAHIIKGERVLIECGYKRDRPLLPPEEEDDTNS